MDILKRFIDIHIPISTCNLKCTYCYVPKAGKYGSERLEFPYSAKHIRRALSINRLGGICLFNVCGMGETLIPLETMNIVQELLEEGHYVTIVTNGILTNRFEQIASFDKELISRLLIKFSLHWMELKRLNKLDEFAYNVRMMRNAGASISVELTANDETEPFIDEIIKYTEKEFGARCHISIPRDESTNGFELLSSHTIDEFYDIWSVFRSELLDFKYKIWGEKRKEYCYAGEWSGLLNVQNGEWRACYHSHFSKNVFENIEESIPFVPIGTHCAISHCFNGHSWLSLGDVPTINSHTYADVRDRLCSDGTHWLTEKYRSFIAQRLCDNNKWPPTFSKKIRYALIKASCYGKKGIRKVIEKKC